MNSILKAMKSQEKSVKSHPLWESVISLLKEEEGSEELLKTWILPIEVDSVDEERRTLSLIFPNQSYETMFNLTYKDEVQKCIYKISGNFYTLLSSCKQESTELEEHIEKDKEEVIQENNLYQTTTIAKTSSISSTLKNKHTFENFVAGSSNSFIYNVALNISEKPGKLYSPFYIYGDSGLGKTHILHAIGNRILEKNPNFKILYTTAEAFTNEYVASIIMDNGKSKLDDFRNKYRKKVDVLLFDDIQFLASKQKVQEEFFHTFQDLINSGMQVVVSGNKKTKDLLHDLKIDSRIVTRLEGGLCQEISKPNFDTRIEILKKKADADDVALTLEVATFIANSIKTNVRELEGSLIKLNAHMSLTGSECTIDFAKNILKDMISKEGRDFYASDEIISAVCKHYSVTYVALKSKTRTKNISEPRQIAMYLTRKYSKMSFPEIGVIFGGKDHSTVMHSIKKIETLLAKNDEKTVKSVENIIKVL